MFVESSTRYERYYTPIISRSLLTIIITDSLKDIGQELNSIREALFDDAATIKDLAQNPASFIWAKLSSVSIGTQDDMSIHI
jgi:hypothetical protein